VKQARVIEHVSEREQGVYTEARGRGVIELTTREGVEHPRGNGDLNAIRELDDETLRGLAP
jgi:hypothetical protein